MLKKIFKKKIKQNTTIEQFSSFFNVFKKLKTLLENNKKQENFVLEPITNAKIRLELEKKDYGFQEGIRLFNEHKYKINNQWINPYNSLNTGWAHNNYAYYNFQTVNYYECAQLSQDPLLNKILSCYAYDTIAKGWINEDIDNSNILLQEQEILKKVLFKTFEMGGCLLYIDFGLKDLTNPLILKNMNMKYFKGLRLIEPLDCCALEVNCNNPSAEDYMKPKKWYVIGLGTCDASHFIYFSYNEPPRVFKPLTMYFGNPLPLLIKQDVYNCNMISQSIAELISRYRYVWLKMDMNKLGTDNAENIKDRLEALALLKDNYQIDLLDLNEEIIQQNTSLSGLFENETFFYQLLASKTDIPYTKLMGKSPEGMNATGEGDAKNYYDKLTSLQIYFKENIALIESLLYAQKNVFSFVLCNKIKFNSFVQLDPLQKMQSLQTCTGALMPLTQFFTVESVQNFLSKNSIFDFNSLEIEQQNEMDENYES